jgi:hypothetical protein
MPHQLAADIPPSLSVHKLVIGFGAGFLAVLVFHQPMLALLTAIGLAKASVYAMDPSAPFGVPRVISLAFWGGIWGIVFALIEGRIPRGTQYWVYAFLFGAIFPTLVAWFVVAPLKAQPVAGGWQASRMMTGLLINGAWGLGTALFLAVGMKMTRGSRAA